MLGPSGRPSEVDVFLPNLMLGFEYQVYERERGKGRRGRRDRREEK